MGVSVVVRSARLLCCIAPVTRVEDDCVATLTTQYRLCCAACSGGVNRGSAQRMAIRLERSRPRREMPHDSRPGGTARGALTHGCLVVNDCEVHKPGSTEQRPSPHRPLHTASHRRTGLIQHVLPRTGSASPPSSRTESSKPRRLPRENGILPAAGRAACHPLVTTDTRDAIATHRPCCRAGGASIEALVSSY
jgi:hypothetical protein